MLFRIEMRKIATQKMPPVIIILQEAFLKLLVKYTLFESQLTLYKILRFSKLDYLMKLKFLII